jgi:hypothetical protein
MNLRLLALVLLSSLVLAACGDSGEESPSAPAASVTADTNPGQTVPATETETPTTTTALPADTTTAETGTDTAPGDGEPNAGDEEGIRVPAAYTYENGALAPRTVSVPAYLRIELSVANRDSATVAVTFRGTTLKVPAGATKSTFVDGLKPGRYPVVTGGGAKAVLVSGAEPGP